VDASVGIKLVLKEELSVLVDDYFSQVVGNMSNSCFVPDLFFIECANILWKKLRQEKVTKEDIKVGAGLLRGLNLTTTPTIQLMEYAIEIGHIWNITAYDASYVALSDQLNAPLLTADNRLAVALKDSSFQILTLDSFQQ